MKRNKTTIVLTAIYTTLVVWIILFKMNSLFEIPNLAHLRTVNLIPFHYDKVLPFQRSEIIKNILIFIPLGIYFKMLKFKNRESIFYGAGMSLTLEILQFVMAIGTTDITDVITNTSGTAIGVSIYCILSLLFRKAGALDKILRILASVCTVLLLALIIILMWVN